MHRLSRTCLVALSAAALVTAPLTATAHGPEPEKEVPGFLERLEQHSAAGDDVVSAFDHAERPHGAALEALGHSYNPASFFHPDIAPPEINSDLAFWGDLVFHGNYDGFRVIDVSDPQNPEELVHARCSGNQGDIVVWEDILVRSWNSPAPEGAMCDGQEVPEGFEGLHVWDISDVTQPEMIAAVRTPCGSHTATAVPDPDNGRLLVYNQGAGSLCFFFDIVSVPLDDPAAAEILWQEPVRGQHGCHDSGVILGDVNMMVCASGHMANVFDIGANEWPGGTLDDPEFLYTIEEEGVGEGEEHSGGWHSGAFTWDGEVIVLGWEPGGGAEAECEATDPAYTKSAFYYDARTGEKLGQWTLPRSQSAEENCTIHNYNVIPMKDGRYIMVSGNYQAGTWVTEFTNPSKPRILGWSDPEPLVPTDLGGAWSSYWYNDVIYESSITEGLNLFGLVGRGKLEAASLELDHLNPQTQMFSIPSPS